MSFDNPYFFCLLLPVFFYIPVVIVRYRKGREGAAIFAAAAPPGERKSLHREIRLRIFFSDVFFLFFVSFLIIALAGPRWGMRITADYRRGVDVILAFDLSRSMNVRDCPAPGMNRPGPAEAFSGDTVSRLDRGINIARDLAGAIGDLRFGAAIGKGRGVLAVPLTYDTETVLTFLNSLDSLALSGRGTNLESLIDAAAASFQDSIPSRRSIILFSDGETLSGSLRAAVEKAAKAGIILSVAGLGTEQGGFVPVEKGPEAPEGFLLDSGGEPVVSSLQDGVLREMAEETGGFFIEGSRTNAAEALANHLNSLSTESRLSGHRWEANPRWRIFILAAMACLACARLMGFTRRKRDYAAGAADHRSYDAWTKKGQKKQKGGKSLAVLTCLILFLAASCGQSQGKLLVMEGNFLNARGFYTEAISSYLEALDYDDAVPYAEYGLASAYFSLEEGSAALERYNAAEEELDAQNREEHLELRYRIHYNRGIIFFEQGEYAEAVSAFREALKVDGSRIEAKRNLELSLLTINRTVPPQTAPQKTTGSGGGTSGGSSSVLFEYLRQKEQEQWKSREWTGEDDYSGPDY